MAKYEILRRNYVLGRNPMTLEQLLLTIIYTIILVHIALYKSIRSDIMKFKALPLKNKAAKPGKESLIM